MSGGTEQTRRLTETIAVNVAHIARGCRSDMWHSPVVYEQAIQEALDALAARVAELEAERDEAEERAAANLGEIRRQQELWTEQSRLIREQAGRVASLTEALRNARLALSDSDISDALAIIEAALAGLVPGRQDRP